MYSVGERLSGLRKNDLTNLIDSYRAYGFNYTGPLLTSDSLSGSGIDYVEGSDWGKKHTFAGLFKKINSEVGWKNDDYPDEHKWGKYSNAKGRWKACGTGRKIWSKKNTFCPKMNGGNARCSKTDDGKSLRDGDCIMEAYRLIIQQWIHIPKKARGDY